MTGHVYLLETEGLFTQGKRPGRTAGERVGGIFEMDRSDWSNGIRYHTFDTRPDAEFKHFEIGVSVVSVVTRRPGLSCKVNRWTKAPCRDIFIVLQTLQSDERSTDDPHAESTS